MKNFFNKPFRWAVVFSLIVALSAGFIFLYTLVIPRAGAQITVKPDVTTSTAPADTEPVNVPVIKTETTYKDANIEINIDTVRRFDTTVYVADIKISSVAYLKTAFAKNTYGRNIKEVTSVMANNNNAIFAINGDYYGFRDYGFVLHNGTLYRDIAGKDDGLAIDSKGNFSIIDENLISAQSLVNSGVWQVLSFGPALINNGKITVDADSEVQQSTLSNPRTAVGMISPLHYIFIVSDGRTSKSAGLSLLELASELNNRGCIIAYNLDGGGSSTMWFNGKVINIPYAGKANVERRVSDIVYFGF